MMNSPVGAHPRERVWRRAYKVTRMVRQSSVGRRGQGSKQHPTLLEFWAEKGGGGTSVRPGKVVNVPGTGKHLESPVMKTLRKASVVVKT